MQKYDDNGNRGSIVARSVRVSKYPILYIIYPNFIESTALHAYSVRSEIQKIGYDGVYSYRGNYMENYPQYLGEGTSRT